MPSLDYCFAPEHPAAHGHFPGNPIIPGAVLLNVTLRAIAQSMRIRLSPGCVSSAQFLHPARPGDTVHIDFSDAAPAAIRFTCTVAQQTVMSGVVMREVVSAPA